MKKILKSIFSKRKKKEIKVVKEVLVINNDNDNRCLCEINADEGGVSGFCFKHHTDWI